MKTLEQKLVGEDDWEEPYVVHSCGHREYVRYTPYYIDERMPCDECLQEEWRDALPSSEPRVLIRVQISNDPNAWEPWVHITDPELAAKGLQEKVEHYIAEKYPTADASVTIGTPPDVWSNDDQVCLDLSMFVSTWWLECLRRVTNP